MKKLLMLMAVIMFSTASVFSQVSEFTVTWYNNECSCSDQGNSYYGVRYSIYDYINDVVVNAGTLVKVDFGTYTVDIEVPEVDANCASQFLDPQYTVLCAVGVFCDFYTPPEGICGTDQKSADPDCDEFAAGFIIECGDFFN